MANRELTATITLSDEARAWIEQRVEARLAEVEAQLAEAARQVEAAENAAGVARADLLPLRAQLAAAEAERDELRIVNVELREQIARLTVAGEDKRPA